MLRQRRWPHTKVCVCVKQQPQKLCSLAGTVGWVGKMWLLSVMHVSNAATDNHAETLQTNVRLHVASYAVTSMLFKTALQSCSFSRVLARMEHGQKESMS